MTTYIFEEKDTLKSRVLDSSYSETIMYTATTSNLLYRKATVISNAGRRPLATINWSSKTFEMGGTTKRTSTMKTKPAGFFDSNWRRTWRWDPSSPEYTVEYKNYRWTATETSSQSVYAVFNCYHPHASRKADPASITFAKNVPDLEQLFLLMVLLRMEARRLDTDNNQAQDNTFNATDSTSQHAIQLDL